MYGYVMEVSDTERISQPSPKELLKDPKSIAIVTGTFYPSWYEGRPQNLPTPDKLRGDLALQTFEEAINQGFQLAIVDGGSSEGFLRTLRDRGIHFEVQEEKGSAGPARKQALEYAKSLKGVKVICQTEPEKVSMIADCLKLASVPILKNEVDIVVPKRDEEGFSSYPSYQAKVERRANKLYNRIIRAHGLLGKDDPDIDFWFGVRVFANKPEITEIFTRQYEFRPSETALQ